jgi:hypothetical protein
MSVKKKSSHTEVLYDIEGEEVMPCTYGDKTGEMQPHTAKVEIIDGELDRVLVFGHVIGARGQVTKQQGVTWFDDDELRTAPEWVQKLAISSIFRGVA